MQVLKSTVVYSLNQIKFSMDKFEIFLFSRTESSHWERIASVGTSLETIKAIEYETVGISVAIFSKAWIEIPGFQIGCVNSRCNSISPIGHLASAMRSSSRVKMVGERSAFEGVDD